MTLTILICVHSTSNFNDELLNKSIQSLVNQTYKKFKTVIVLDQCWDKTKEMILSLNHDLDLTILTKEQKQGLSYAKNFGLRHIDTEWVGFLDADDLYLPNKLEEQVKYIENNNVDFLGTKSWYINGNNEDVLYTNWYLNNTETPIYESHDEIKSEIFKSNVLTHGSMLVKKECINKLNGYQDVRGMEDWDLWKRGILNNFIFHQLQDKLYIYRRGTSVPL
jgi:glycosyltransferase involved in cell wall biosynthesis